MHGETMKLISRINLCISLVYFCLHYWNCTVQKTK